MHWVQGELFSLKHAQEDQLEHYFASLKRPYQGTPTFKDLVVAAQVHHRMLQTCSNTQSFSIGGAFLDLMSLSCQTGHLILLASLCLL